MCQPPEITLQGQAEAFEQATTNEGWNSDGCASPTPRNQADAPWPEDRLPVAEDPQSLSNLTAQFMEYNQQQQQQLQMQQQSAQIGWGQGLGPNLAEKLRMAAANASHKQQMNNPAQAQLNWMSRNQNAQSFPTPGGTAPAAMWPAPTQTMMGGLTPQLVAQGIPLGMGQLGQMGQMYGQIEIEEDDDDKDPKKFKRMMSNRASAKRSRQRRQERLDELEIVSAKLHVENSAVQRKLHEAQDRIKKFQAENESLQEELRSLKEMLGAKAAMNTNTMTTTTTSGSRPGHAPASPRLLLTKQDSCGANGSTTDNPSSGPSSTPSPQVDLGKRRHEQMNQAESSFQEQGEVQRLKTHATPVTPSNGTTSNSQEVAAVEETVVPGVLGILDDDLFTTFMDDCFEAKPLDAVLARQ